jgi:uracil phosphoribosyltransferase
MRQKDRSTNGFRALLHEIGELLAYEVTRDLPLSYEEIETPLAKMKAPLLSGKKVVLVSILRAGSGLTDGILRLLPSARVGHIGLYRNPETMGTVEYYYKLPSELADRPVIIADPLLATGNSAAAAVYRVKTAKPSSIKLVCLLAAPEGLQNFHEQHPDVTVYTAAIDDGLDENGYIIPGVGDAGNRLFGTK